MNTPKVTVTVPIYGVEKYLRQCLDSLKAQTLKDIEFILVDDCSPDGCPAICDEYTTADERFRVIHRKQNGGLAAARQDGLNAAKGEYVIVCDADDWVEPDMYELLYNNAKKNKADISTCDWYTNYDDGKQVLSHHEITATTQEELIKDALTQKLPAASWAKMVRREFILNNRIYYEQGINMGEDHLILLKLLLCNPKISKIDIPLYHYRRVSAGNSYTNAPKYSHYQQLRWIEEWKYDNLDRTVYARELFHGSINIAYLGLRVKDMQTEEHKAYMRECCPWSAFFKYCRFDLKALVIMASKGSRSFGVFLFKTLSRYFYK